MAAPTPTPPATPAALQSQAFAALLTALVAQTLVRPGGERLQAAADAA